VTVPFEGVCAVCAVCICNMRLCVFIANLFCAMDVRVYLCVCVCVSLQVAAVVCACVYVPNTDR
jgi:hypothetical protein